MIHQGALNSKEDLIEPGPGRLFRFRQGMRVI